MINDKDAPSGEVTLPLHAIRWKKREIENYFASPDILRKHARTTVPDDWPDSGPIFSETREQERDRRAAIMDEVIQFLVPPVALQDFTHSFWTDGKGSDFLDSAFSEFYLRVGLRNPMSKSTYHRLAALAKPDELDQEIIDVLDHIVEVAQQARPAGD